MHRFNGEEATLLRGDRIKCNWEEQALITLVRDGTPIDNAQYSDKTPANFIRSKKDFMNFISFLCQWFNFSFEKILEDESSIVVELK